MAEAGGRDGGSRDGEAVIAGHRLAAAVGELLLQRQESMALAESCTGGLIGAAITSVPGSSDYLWGSAVVYSAAAKRTMLGLHESILDKHGTVSSETTAALAASVKKISGATHGLAVTGWAGPGGGTEADPMGTIYLALALSDEVKTRRCCLQGTRDEVRDQALVIALEWLRDELVELNRAGTGTGQ